MKVYYSYVEVLIIGAKRCNRSIAPIAYFVPITLFCSDSLFYRLSEHKDLSYFETFNMPGCMTNCHSSCTVQIKPLISQQVLFINPRWHPAAQQVRQNSQKRWYLVYMYRVNAIILHVYLLICAML